jgi:hypothetical protein
VTNPDRDPQEPGRAWMRGELSSRDYFAMARREAARDRHQPATWSRLTQWIKRVLKREAP